MNYEMSAACGRGRNVYPLVLYAEGTVSLSSQITNSVSTMHPIKLFSLLAYSKHETDGPCSLFLRVLYSHKDAYTITSTSGLEYRSQEAATFYRPQANLLNSQWTSFRSPTKRG